MKIEEARKILWSYKDLRGYDLTIKEEHGSLILNDGIVNVNITSYSEAQLRREIQDWLDTAYEAL